jgi:cytochrome P450/NADPH-cytochrome P450 reductase
MVGAGTGLAPYRGFLQERAALKTQGNALGPAILFFGCRNPGQDYLYEEELQSFATDGVVEVACAFSRVEGKPKQYVQQVITERGDEVWQLLQQNAVVFVCGDASRMAPDVRRAFGTLYQSRSGADDAGVQTWLSDLDAQHRYVADVWPTT